MSDTPPRPGPAGARPWTLRPASPDDALCLGVLGLQVFLDTYATGGIRPTLAREVLAQFDTAGMRRLLQRAGAPCFVAELDGHLIGFVHLRPGLPQATAVPAPGVELERLYVQEPFVRQGIGRALLQRAEAAARDLGARTLWLTAWVHNHRALRFYAASGYRDVGRDWYRFENEAHENRLLVKDLVPT